MSEFLRNASILSGARANNLGGFKRFDGKAIQIRNKLELQDCLHWANSSKTPLHIFSGGKNWGYGSALNAKSVATYLSLKGMNQIISIDEEMGIATIEPGVTQKQLAEELRRRKSRFFLDVTGSGAETTVVGNALERGVAYQGLRVHQVVGLELLLGRGDYLRTGFGGFERQELAGLYPHGIGASFDSLFFQSNFAIVTEMKIKLLRRPEQVYSITFSVTASQLPALIDTLAELRRQEIVQGIAHIADRERTISTLKPLMRSKPGEDILPILQDVISGDYSASVVVSGPKPIAESRLRILRKALKSVTRVFVYDHMASPIKRGSMQLLLKLAATEGQRRVLAAASQLRDFNLGVASDAGIEFLKSQGRELDDCTEGFLLCTPLAPLRAASAEYFKSLVDRARNMYQLPLGMTLNMISDQILEAVISVRFDRANPTAIEKAHSCCDFILFECIDKGLYPYRVNIDQMEKIVALNPKHFKLVEDIRNILDPNHILSPGRYSLS